MTPIEAPSVSVTRRGSAACGSDPRRVVVWVRGEHDIATRERLSAVIGQASCGDDVDVVVDLSGVTFMDASTIGAIVEAHNRLRSCCRSLCVRAPAPIARRLLEVCELGFLIDGHPTTPRGSVAALESWVVVPASDPGPGATQPPVDPPAPPEQSAHLAAHRPGRAVTSVPPQRTPT